ncbi:MAG: DUF6444 domain-containing protein [Actinomycetota bacterium]|nr:DUF6444 domain-containing protein [Actinomycetota bacterium]
MSAPEQPSPSYEQLTALVAGLTSQLERAHARIAELEARLGRDSTNSSQPSSKDSIAAKAKRRADRSSRERSKDRKPGGQPGHKGSGLAPTVTPDRTETLPAPGDCSGCGADLADAAAAGMGWAQLWDIPPITLEKVHYLLPRRRCRCCGKTTTAVPPCGATGTVAYGPNVNAAAILLASEGNVPVERTAALMAAMLSAPVSTGFVARALERFAERLAGAGFDEAMTEALRAEDVLCGDETPTNVIGKDTDEQGQPVPGSRTRSPYAPPTRGWSGTPRSAPAPRPPSPAWVCWRATPGTWSVTTTSAGTSSTPNSPGSGSAPRTSSATPKASFSCTPPSSSGPGRSSRCCVECSRFY